MICGANNAVEHYGKVLKSCMGVLLKADLTGHSHPTRFGRKGLDGREKKIGDLFCPVHISGFFHSVIELTFEYLSSEH